MMKSPLTKDSVLDSLCPETGEAPPRRLKCASSAEEILRALELADDESSRARAKVDAMIDGEPPYDPEKLKALGQSYRCNLNFLEGAAAIEAAETGYLDLTNSVDRLAEIVLDTGDPVLDPERSRIVSEEFTRLHKDEWKRFDTNTQLLARWFVSQGVSIAYREDSVNWQWSVSRLGDFLIQRGTELGEDEIEIAFVRRTYRPHQLYQKIKDVEAAEAVGWDVEAVKRAIYEASGAPANKKFSRANWEALERELKNNDLNVGIARGTEIKLAHGWVTEFSGKVSHFIILQSGNTEEFLYYAQDRYDEMNQAITVFAYGVGNGELHSIRGLGYKIFPFIQVSNRLRCQAIDGASISSSIILQPEDEEDLEELGMVQLGPCSILPSGLNVVQASLPNVGTQVLPVIRELGMTMENNTGSYRTRSTQPTGQERTKFEVQAQLQKEAMLSVSAMSLFYRPWGELLRESYRRLTNPDYAQDDPGGVSALKFIRRCHARGVTKEMLRKVVSISPVRAIGHGSPEMRLLALEDLGTLAGQLDDVGRDNLLRDRIAARMGYDSVARYVPNRGVDRPTQDQKNAMLENNALRMGIPQQAFSDDLPVAHLAVHIPVAIEIFQQAQQLGGADPSQILPPLMAIITHCHQHLEALSLDQSEEAQAYYGQARKAVGQMNEAVQHLQLKAQRMQREQQQAQQEGGGGGGGEGELRSAIDPRTLSSIQQAQAKMDMMRAEHDQRLRHNEEMHRQKLELEDATKAAEILNQQ